MKAEQITIWVTGKTGQLGQCLKDTFESHPQFRVVYTSQSDIHLFDPKAIDTFLKVNEIDFVVNAAAYTAVDAAESNTTLAEQVNTHIPKFLAQACDKLNVQLIHISTDYVFDGTAKTPYSEENAVNPKSVYGLTKLNGEREIQKVNESAIIIRTSWLYSEYGHNFVKTMLKLGKDKSEIKVVNDQVGSPTYAADLADAIAQIISNIQLNGNASKGGVYHFTNAESCSWFDLAKRIMTISGLSCTVQPCSTAEYPTAAVRPAYSVLQCEKIKTTYNLQIAPWQEALSRCLLKIQNS